MASAAPARLFGSSMRSDTLSKIDQSPAGMDLL
jgi:hypothetical protein